MGYRLVTFFRDSAREPQAGVDVDGRIYALDELLRRADASDGEPLGPSPTVLNLLGRWRHAAPVLERLAEHAGRSDVASVSRREARLSAPILYPPGVFCSGPNYLCHLAEMTKGERTTIDKRTTRPFFFSKPAAHTIIGPGAPIEVPGIAARVDWEAELAVVIGAPARDVSVEDAMDCVAGYTIMNDVSARDLFQRDEWPAWKDWLSCKGFDSSAPLGPGIVPASQVPDPYDLSIRLWVNDELHQDGSTSGMVFSIAEQIAFLSERVTLRPGDVLATGTPAGVGMAKGLFLKPGDVVRVEIAGLGVLQNPVVERSAQPHLNEAASCKPVRRLRSR